MAGPCAGLGQTVAMAHETLHTFTDDALGRDDATEVARRIAEREVSAVEVVEAAAARTERARPLAAVVELDVDGARRRAARLDAAEGPDRGAGAFAGVPTFIKDQIDVVGMATRYGSAAHAGAGPATRNDPVAQQLFDMGLLSLGKSALPEYGFIPSTEFPDDEPTRNPWNLAHTAGGSSGGAAALVAAGVVPVAHAADGGGSIRIPAACCGLVGCKPSRGRLPRSGMHEPLVGLVTDGIVSRSVRDTALYLAEVERLAPNRRLAPVGHVRRPPVRPLRIGAITEAPVGAPLDEANRRELAASLRLLESLGHEVTEIDAPAGEEFAEDFVRLWATLALLSALTGKVLRDPTFDRAHLGRFTHELGDHARSSLAQLPATIARLRRSARRDAEVFTELDVVVSPTLGHLPPALGHLGIDQSFDDMVPKLLEWACFTPWANATGAPSLSMPLGHDDPTGLPVGILLSAARGDERTLLQLALELEAAAPVRALG